MVQTFVIQGTVAWNFFRDPHSDNFIGVCDALRLTCFGSTLGELHEMIEDTMQTLMVGMVETGELRDFLTQKGWQMAGPLPAKIVPGLRFEIPTDIHQRPASEFQAAAC